MSQHVPANIRSGNLSHSSRMTQSAYEFLLGQHLFDNPDIATKYVDSFFDIISLRLVYSLLTCV